MTVFAHNLNYMLLGKEINEEENECTCFNIKK